MKHVVLLADLGQTTSEAKVVKWLKKPGEKVAQGEYLLEVETDKVTMQVEAYVGGYLREALVEEGHMASALAPIAILTDTPEEHYERPRAEAASMAAAPHEAPVNSPNAPSHHSGDLAVAPAARVLARELGIDLRAVAGTGPGGLITRKDIEQSARARGASKPMAAMAALVTRSMQTIPHFYMAADADVSAAERWKENWNAAHRELSATFNDIFVRAASKALRDTPRMNVSFQDGRFEPRSSADVLLVAATGAGLSLVPLADPGSQSWEEFLRSTREGLAKVEEGRAAESPRGASPLLAISNLGMFRVKQFVAIIPPSCTAILAVGAVRDVPVVVNQQVTVGRVASLTLSADHRVVDGITAANFMEKLQEHLNAL